MDDKIITINPMSSYFKDLGIYIEKINNIKFIWMPDGDVPALLVCKKTFL